MTELPESRIDTGKIIKQVNYAWYGDLENLITKVYDKPGYSILDGDGAEHSQDSLIKFEVGPEGDIYGDIDDLTVEEWVAGEEKTLPWGYVMKQPSLSAICNDLFAKGLIPAGGYVVHIWW